MQQQTGVPLKQMVQVQPASQHLAIQSQQAWIWAQHFASPELQEMHTPSAVHSHAQRQRAKLHWQTQIPFCVQQTEQRPSQSALQRFCNVAQASSSSQTHFSFAPSLHFSILIVQRGTSTEFGEGPTAGVADAGRPVAP